MKLQNVVSVVGLAAALVAAHACKKQEDKAPEPTTKPSGSAAPAGAVAPKSNTPPDDVVDHITVLAHHKNPKPADPVRINFEKFRVVKADFDPKMIEGGKATIELDLSSFHTDSGQRDGHLKSPAYLDVGKFATATIDVDNVKQKAGSTYTADATVTAHGITKKYPVTFDVIETKDDGIKIKGEQMFPRLDFGVGTDPTKNGEEQVGVDVTIQMTLTLKKT
jgi:polyisoprenoid-binding protein YceI